MIYKSIETKYLIKASDGNPRNSEASIIKLNNGALFLVYQHCYESKNGSNDHALNSLNVLYSYDEGITWQDERVLINTPENCINVYSPNLFRFENGDLGLIYMLRMHEGKSIFVLRSEDDGESFFEYSNVTEKTNASISNDCLRRLSNGRLLLPSTYMTGDWPNDTSIVKPFYSDDDGKTWISSETIIALPMRGAMEPFVAEIGENYIIMVMRNQLGSVFKSVSYDGGETWSKPQTTGLIAPESCPYLINIPNSKAILVGWNNSQYDMNWASHFGKRTPLTIAISYDGLETAEEVINIESDPKRAFTNIGATWVTDSKLLLTYWSTKYFENGSFGGPIDLKQALVEIDREKLED